MKVAWVQWLIVRAGGTIYSKMIDVQMVHNRGARRRLCLLVIFRITTDAAVDCEKILLGDRDRVSTRVLLPVNNSLFQDKGHLLVAVPNRDMCTSREICHAHRLDVEVFRLSNISVVK